MAGGVVYFPMEYYWVRASSSDFTGTLPQRRSGHTAVIVSRSKIVFFGGFVDKKFISNLVVYDTERKAWFEPKCIGSGHEEGEVGPTPRAFHAAVSIDFHMFVFGGRSGTKRLGDFWVLDTETWQWTELCGFGDLPSPRDFSAASSAGNEKIVIFGGWDGKKWLSDVYILDTVSLEWAELSVSGSLPPPRCGHTATMLEKRLLVYGGRGGGGPIMGDLWALKGLVPEEGEAAGWTQLKLGGHHPSPRCGHTFTSGGHYLLLFGGHGTGGWLSRYDVYHNHCVVLDRVSAQWKRLAVRNEPPPPRAYHSMTCLGSRFLLFGGFDGKTTYDDVWWLVSDGDAMANRVKGVGAASARPKTDAASADGATTTSPRVAEVDDDADFLDVANSLLRGEASKSLHTHTAVQFLRRRWIESTPHSLSLKELAPLLRDYRRFIAQKHMKVDADLRKDVIYRFYHVKSAKQLRMDDIPLLLQEYKLLLSDDVF